MRKLAFLTISLAMIPVFGMKGSEVKSGGKFADAAHEIYYDVAKANLNLLEEQAVGGDLSSKLALYDFYKSLEDPCYKIVYSASQRVLGALLDESKTTIHPVTREAFKKFEKNQ